MVSLAMQTKLALQSIYVTKVGKLLFYLEVGDGASAHLAEHAEAWRNKAMEY